MKKTFEKFIFNRGDKFPFFVTLVDIMALDQPLIYANKFFKDFTGYKDSEILGRNCRFLQKDADPEVRRAIREAIKKSSPICQDMINFKKNQETFYNRLVLIPIRGEKQLYLGLQNVISEAEFRNFPELSDSEILDKTINPLSILFLSEQKDPVEFERHFCYQVERLQKFIRHEKSFSA